MSTVEWSILGPSLHLRNLYNKNFTLKASFLSATAVWQTVAKPIPYPA